MEKDFYAAGALLFPFFGLTSVEEKSAGGL